MIQVYKIMTKKENVDPGIWFESLADHRGEGIRTRYSDGLYNVRQHVRTFSARGFANHGMLYHTMWKLLPL